MSPSSLLLLQSVYLLHSLHSPAPGLRGVELGQSVVSWCSYIESDLYSIERDLYGRQTQIHGSMSYVVEMDSFIGAKTNARSRMCPLFPDVDIDTNVHKEGRRTFSCAFRHRQYGGRGDGIVALLMSCTDRQSPRTWSYSNRRWMNIGMS